jgi:hypothetical protein
VLIAPSPQKLDKGKRDLKSIIPKVVEQGKKVWVPLKSNIEGVNPSRKQHPLRIVPLSHHCGKVSHIQPHFHLLRSRMPKKVTTPSRTYLEDLVSMVRNFVRSLDKLEGVRTVPRSIGPRNCKSLIL